VAAPARTWMTGETPDVFEQLFRREYAKVVAIAYRVLGNSQAAEDVAQDVFWSFYRGHSPDAAYAAPWLHRAAAHTALNVVRGEKRRTTREVAVTLERERVMAADQSGLDPARALEESEERRRVQVALKNISKKSATVLALRYSGLSYAEVAAALGVRVGQIGTLLRRAEASLRKELTRETH
jgi:RNA polymerase sigma factor (sigma-70 family)